MQEIFSRPLILLQYDETTMARDIFAHSAIILLWREKENLEPSRMRVDLKNPCVPSVLLLAIALYHKLGLFGALKLGYATLK